MPRTERDIPFNAAGMVTREGEKQLCNDLAPSGRGTPPGGKRKLISGRGTPPGGKRKLIRGAGSAAQISNKTRPQDPSGGEVQLTPSRDVAVTRLMIQPTLQSGGGGGVVEDYGLVR